MGEHARVTPQEKDKITYYAKLAAEGLFDKEYVTNTFDVKEDKFYTGKAGVIFGSSAETVDIYRRQDGAGPSGREHHADAAADPQGPRRPGPCGRGREQGGARLGDRSTSTHKEEVATLLDFIASNEGQVIDRLGFEGSEYTRTRRQGELQRRSRPGMPALNAANWPTPSGRRPPRLPRTRHPAVQPTMSSCGRPTMPPISTRPRTSRRGWPGSLPAKPRWIQWDQYVQVDAAGQRLQAVVARSTCSGARVTADPRVLPSPTGGGLGWGFFPCAKGYPPLTALRAETKTLQPSRATLPTRGREGHDEGTRSGT